MKYLCQRGDTIVEVLIALAVVTTVLGGAYGSAQKSLNGARIAQERGEAIKVTESQLEKLKNETSNSSAFSVTTLFCMDLNGDVTAYAPPDLSPSVSSFPDATTLTPATFDTYPFDCIFENRYRASIIRDAATQTFTVQVLWERPGGNGYEEIKMVYRFYG